MCVDMCIDMCIGMRIDMCVGMPHGHGGVLPHHMRIDTCKDMRIDRNAYGHAYRHIQPSAYTRVWRFATCWGSGSGSAFPSGVGRLPAMAAGPGPIACQRQNIR